MSRPTYKVVALSDRHAFIKLSDRIGLITKSLKRPGKNGRRAAVVSAYFGFSTQAEATAFVRSLRGYFPKSFCQVRPSQRLATAYEVKVRAFAALERFAWTVAAKPAIVTPAEAKASILPTEPIVPVRSVQPMTIQAMTVAPVQLRSYRSKTVGGLAIE